MSRRKRSRASGAATATIDTQVMLQQQRAKRTLAYGSLEADLVAAISQQLPFGDLAKDQCNRELIFARYIDSVQVLDRRRQQLLTLSEALAMVTVKYETPLKDEVRAEVEKQIKSDFRFRLDAPANYAGAEVGALPVEEIREHLAEALKAAAERLIAQFLEGLDGLIERQLLGVAHWPGQNAVKYRFYQQRIRAQAEERTVTTETSQSVTKGWLSHTVETIRRQVTVLSTPLEISLDCHHHDAINAFQTNIENSKVVMPAAVQQLIMAIPDWMRPLIRIIDGYLVRERVDPKKTSHTSVVTEVKEEVFTEVNQLQGGGRIQDAWQSLSEALIDEEPIDGWPANRYGFDPAVMLGRIVLTGWGPQEIEKAKAETRQQELIVKSGVEGRFWLGCALALLIPAACFIAGPGAVPQSFLLAAMLFLSSVFCLSAALRNLLERALTPVDELKFQALMAGPTLTLAGVLVSLANIANPWLLLGLLILLAGLGLSHKVASYLLPNFRF